MPRGTVSERCRARGASEPSPLPLTPTTPSSRWPTNCRRCAIHGCRDCAPRQRAFEMLPNTAPFDCTHHPAMSLPCGMVDGLPVGVMLASRAFGEETIYPAAAAFESGVDWRSAESRLNSYYGACHGHTPRSMFLRSAFGHLLRRTDTHFRVPLPRLQTAHRQRVQFQRPVCGA